MLAVMNFSKSKEKRMTPGEIAGKFNAASTILRRQFCELAGCGIDFVYPSEEWELAMFNRVTDKFLEKVNEARKETLAFVYTELLRISRKKGTLDVYGGYQIIVSVKGDTICLLVRKANQQKQDFLDVREDIKYFLTLLQSLPNKCGIRKLLRELGLKGILISI